MQVGKSQEGIRRPSVNKFRVPGCLKNHANGEKRTVFELPKDKDLQNKWFCFLTRDDLETPKHVFICYKHFAHHFVNKFINEIA